MKFNKKGASFGTIVGVFGAILIALGVAWLIAQNWHQIPAPVKIIILLSATSGAYAAGTMLRVREYTGIGKALLVLGALLYSLSIFLIAQIYSTSTSWQGQAWLWLLCWIGVLASAYIFDSSASLVVGLVEVCIWLVIQFIAFAEKMEYNNSSFGILALYFLAMGVLSYGLALLHRSAGHKFGRVYLFWTAFYFMAFAYVLSFQTLLPHLWADGLQFSPAIIFLLSLAAISIAAFVFGIIASLNTASVQTKEIAGIFALIVMLVLLISSASLVSSSIGTCYEKQCYDFRDQSSCVNSNLQSKCQWVNNYCNAQSQNCYTYKNENDCAKNSCKWNAVTRCDQKNCNTKQSQSSCEASSGCKWAGNYCTEKESCSQFTSQNPCENAQNANCEWLNNYCSPVQQNCYNYRTQNSCEKSNCEWSTTGQCDYGTNSYSQTNSCYNNYDATSCGNAKGCHWNINSNYCDVERPCDKYSSDKISCNQQAQCGWRQDSYYSYFGRQGNIPLSLWAIWIFANLIFLLLILGVIGYGTWQKNTKIINLGILFFSLDILTRYIGFAMDFWGYTGLSIMFIAGGITLLIGAFFIEKWRRKLVSQVITAPTPAKPARPR